MTYRLHAGAEDDITQALDFYHATAGLLVAQRFLAEFQRVAELLDRHPELGVPTVRGRRRFGMRIFPYSLVYRSVAADVEIIVVRHNRLRPGFAGART